MILRGKERGGGGSSTHDRHVCCCRCRNDSPRIPKLPGQGGTSFLLVTTVNDKARGGRGGGQYMGFLENIGHILHPDGKDSAEMLYLEEVGGMRSGAYEKRPMEEV